MGVRGIRGVRGFRVFSQKMFYLGEWAKSLDILHNFISATTVFGTKIAQQSISCGDNCTPQ